MINRGQLIVVSSMLLSTGGNHFFFSEVGEFDIEIE